jgi:hypothetical protein
MLRARSWEQLLGNACAKAVTPDNPILGADCYTTSIAGPHWSSCNAMAKAKTPSCVKVLRDKLTVLTTWLRLQSLAICPRLYVGDNLFSTRGYLKALLLFVKESNASWIAINARVCVVTKYHRNHNCCWSYNTRDWINMDVLGFDRINRAGGLVSNRNKLPVSFQASKTWGNLLL